MPNHTVEFFDQELHRLREMVETMGRLAGGSSPRPSMPWNDRTQTLPDTPSTQADRMKHEIHRLAIRLLTLRHSAVINLREVLSAQRIAIELERICDYAQD